MILAPLLAADPAIQLHALSALLAVPIGALVLWRPKGTRLHKTLGRAWIALMLSAALSSLLIHEMQVVGPFGPIHALTLVVLWTLGRGLWAIAIRRDVAGHRAAMEDLYVWSLLLAGAFTFWPCRRMHQVVFGPEGSGPAVWAFLLAALAGVLLWHRKARRRPPLRP